MAELMFLYETRVDSDGSAVEAGGFVPSSSPRFTREELVTTARVVTSTAVEPDYVFTSEAHCPCCDVPIPRAEYLDHIERPPFWCDRERWGSWGEAVDYFEDD